MPSILLTKRQAEVGSFPPTSSVSILDQGNGISRGFSTEQYVRQDELRFQVGCKVKVRCCSFDNVSPKMESLEGVVLGTCEIPTDDDRHDCANPHKNFWYSIQVIGASDGSSFASRILHEACPDGVTLASLSIEDTPIEEDSMPIEKGSDLIQEKVKRIKVLNINIISKKNHNSCQLKIGCCEKSEKQKFTTNEDVANESMKRKLDVLYKDDLSAAITDDLSAEIRDDSSACTMVPDVYIKNEEDNETLWNSGLVTRHRKCRKIDNTNQELMKVHSYASLNSKLAPRGRTMMSRYCDFQIDQEECYELSI
jgi:hypothetical protein